MTDVANDRDPGWEYLLLAHSLREAVQSHEDAYKDFRVGFAEPTKQRIVNVVDVPQDLRSRCDEASTRVANVERLFSPESTEAAIGKPGEPGDSELIRRLAIRIADVYKAQLDWAASIRGCEVPTKARAVYDALALIMAEPIEEFRAFTMKFVQEVDEAIADLRAGRTPKNAIVAKLILTINDAAMKKYEQALENFTNAVTSEV